MSLGLRARRGLPTALLPLVAILVGAASIGAQAVAEVGGTLERVSMDFASTWTAGKAGDLAAYFAPVVRFTERGVTHDGARPMHVAETLERFRSGYEGRALDLERVEPMDPEGESGFAQLVWLARNRESGTPRRYTFLITWRRTKAGWRIEELRLIP